MRDGGAGDGGAGAAEAGPGRAARRRGGPRDGAVLRQDGAHAFPPGLSRDGKPVYGNLEFLDGTRGAHVNISGISGVATKTTYALFLLYGLFHSTSLRNAHSTHAIIFNVKGEDLLWLDKPNGAPARGRAPQVRRARPAGGAVRAASGSGRRRSAATWSCRTRAALEGVTAYFWTLREFCRERMLRFLFAEADDETSQLSFVDHAGGALPGSADGVPGSGPRRRGPARAGRRCRASASDSLRALVSTSSATSSTASRRGPRRARGRLSRAASRRPRLRSRP